MMWPSSRKYLCHFSGNKITFICLQEVNFSEPRLWLGGWAGQHSNQLCSWRVVLQCQNQRTHRETFLWQILYFKSHKAVKNHSQHFHPLFTNQQTHVAWMMSLHLSTPVVCRLGSAILQYLWLPYFFMCFYCPAVFVIFVKKYWLELTISRWKVYILSIT